MALRVTFVELSAFESMLPLVSGYLQAYAIRDPAIAQGVTFDTCAVPAAGILPERLAADLGERDADLYAISCYIWNMGAVRRLLPLLRAHRPDAHIVLGGPQAMNHAADYVAPGESRTLVCNGEGEVTFAELLRQLLAARPDLAQVPGLSFWRDGELVTTANAPRISDFMDIPSPFTSGVFADGRYTTAVLETNRGCPFHCTFCYWGAATNDKVHKLELQRTLDDVTWISEHHFVALFIADANWGMAPRDVEVTKHIVACRQRTGYPLMVAMAAAKNRPERMSEITEILVRGGLLTTQPISLQTLSGPALKMVERDNIRPEKYIQLQRSLREKQISSYIELIWPLPGETPASFREGIMQLCRAGADTIIVYPHLLLHNTPMYDRQEVLGLRLQRVPDPAAEADVVIETKWVSGHEYAQGVWFAYVMHTFYNLRCLYYLANDLDRRGILSFAELFEAAAQYFQTRLDNPVPAFFADSVASLANYSMLNNGHVAHLVLHEHRAELTELLDDFVRAQPWGRDAEARAAFELDLLARPYIYRERFCLPEYRFSAISAVPAENDKIEVGLPPSLAQLLAELDIPMLRDQPPERLVLDHDPGNKMPFMSRRTLEHNLSYCQGMVLRLREFLPTWHTLAAAPVGSER